MELHTKYAAPISRPTTRFATRIAPCGSACYCFTDVGGQAPSWRFHIDAKAAHNWQLNVSATTHNVSTRPTRGKSVRDVVAFLHSRSCLKSLYYSSFLIIGEAIYIVSSVRKTVSAFRRLSPFKHDKLLPGAVNRFWTRLLGGQI